MDTLFFPHKTTQVSRAAHLVCSFAQFWFAKIEQRLPPDIVHGVPYCMDEYDRLFSSARIPLSGCDRWHERGDISKHIVILRGSHLYKVNVITLDGVICVDILEDILKRVILSSLSPAMTTNNLRLGDFTTAERDVWCHARSHLVQSSARTRSSLDDIDNAMFVLSLDLEPAFDDDDFVAVSLHGGHRSGTQEHRWYDKTNFIVDENGRASGNFEHSLYDGAAIRRLCDETWYMSNGIPTGREKWSYRWSSKTSREWFSTFSPLLFDPLNEKEKEILKKISNEHVQNQKNVHIVQGTFDDFGKDILKQEFSGASPDGILQILFKLTYAKVHGWNGKGNGGVYVYESCQTKRFLCGRTEVIRTATLASNQFVDYMMEHEMLNTSIDVNVARNLFRNAAEKHVEIAKLASNGQGVDRHLFSLFRLAGMEDGGAVGNQSFMWPTKGVFTSGFGWRWGRMHKGIDIANNVGTPIVAAKDGVVKFSGWSSGYGYLVELAHADGSSTRYAHNSRLLVRKGQIIPQGVKISLMGSTGRSTGPHLHFEIRQRGGSALDPMAKLPARRRA